jgi:hypothetical protein
MLDMYRVKSLVVDFFENGFFAADKGISHRNRQSCRPQNPYHLHIRLT